MSAGNEHAGNPQTSQRHNVAAWHNLVHTEAMTPSQLAKSFAEKHGYVLTVIRTDDGKTTIAVACNDKTIGYRVKYDGALSLMRADLAAKGDATMTTVKAVVERAQRPWVLFSSWANSELERFANYADAIKTLRQVMNDVYYRRHGGKFTVQYRPY